MATCNISMPVSSATYMSPATPESVRQSLLKRAKIVIALYQTSDATTVSTVALVDNVAVRSSCAIWNGARFYTTTVTITWSKANGTVTLVGSYTERDATVSIVGYHLIF